MDKSAIFSQTEYEALSGPDWPSYGDFCRGIPATDPEIQAEINGFVEEKQRYRPVESGPNSLIKNFLTMHSQHGDFVVNRHDQYVPISLLKTGKTHIEHELKKIFEVLDCLSDGAVIIDGGANIGFFSLPVSQYVKPRGAKLISIEPQRMIYYALCGTLALNDVYNCWPHNIALGDVDQVIEMPSIRYDRSNDFGLISVAPPLVSPAHAVTHGMTGSTVPMHRIDSLALDRVDFIKLDLEGNECGALRGAQQILQRDRPWIWVEYYVSGTENIRSLLPDDYCCHVVDEFNMLCAPRLKIQDAKLGFLN